MNEIIPEYITQEGVQEIYNKKSYSNQHDCRKDTYYLSKYLILLTYNIYNAKKEFNRINIEYRKLLGKHFEEVTGENVYEKESILFIKHVEISEKYKQVSEAEEEINTYRKIYFTVQQLIKSIENLSWNLKGDNHADSTR